MTQTTPSHSQAVEAADIAMAKACGAYVHGALNTPGSFVFSADELHAYTSRIRAELTSQQEVAAPVSDEENEKFSRDVSNFKGSDPEATKFALEQFAANRARVPVASLAEPAAYDKQEIDLLVHRITGQDTAEDSIDALQNAVRILDGKTIAAVVDELYDASQPKAPAPVPVVQGEAYNGEEWELLAMALAAEEHDDIHHLIWEGGPVPEPWGEVWQKYEGEARRMISLVREHATPANMAVGAVGGVGARRTPAEIVALKERGEMQAFLKGLTKTRGYICLREFIRQMQENGTACDDEGEDTDALAELADAIALAAPAPEQATTGSGQGPTDADRYLHLRNKRPAMLITGFFGNGCVNKTIEDAEAEIDAAILSTASPAGEERS